VKRYIILLVCCVLFAAGFAATIGGKQALAQLWQRGFLPNAIKKIIVDRLLDLRLVEEHPHDLARFPTLRELKIMGYTNFPFPQAAWIEYGYVIGIDRRPVMASDDFGNSRSLENADGRYLGSLGGTYSGHPTARAIIQIREVDYQHRPPKTLWTIRKELTPLTLRHQERSPNQAMQRTASKPAIDVPGVCHPRFGCVVGCRGLAVADLVSR
jgi:hypothetical protein